MNEGDLPVELIDAADDCWATMGGGGATAAGLLRASASSAAASALRPSSISFSRGAGTEVFLLFAAAFFLGTFA
jgi:hypothetical protein